jgi:hypothetical protein
MLSLDEASGLHWTKPELPSASARKRPSGAIPGPRGGGPHQKNFRMPRPNIPNYIWPFSWCDAVPEAPRFILGGSRLPWEAAAQRPPALFWGTSPPRPPSKTQDAYPLKSTDSELGRSIYENRWKTQDKRTKTTESQRPQADLIK